MGFQMKDTDDVANELGLPGSQILAKFFEAFKKIYGTLNSVLETTAAKDIGIEDKTADDSAVPVQQSLNEELSKAAKVGLLVCVLGFTLLWWNKRFR